MMLRVWACKTFVAALFLHLSDLQRVLTAEFFHCSSSSGLAILFSFNHNFICSDSFMVSYLLLIQNPARQPKGASVLRTQGLLTTDRVPQWGWVRNFCQPKFARRLISCSDRHNWQQTKTEKWLMCAILTEHIKATLFVNLLLYFWQFGNSSHWVWWCCSARVYSAFDKVYVCLIQSSVTYSNQPL